MRACNAHLNSQQLDENGEYKPFYTKVDESKQDDAKIKLTNLNQEAFDNKIIVENEFLAMNPQDKGPGRFYCTFKVHKKHDEGKAPPERPIVNGSNSITENASLFVEHHINYQAQVLLARHTRFPASYPTFKQRSPASKCYPCNNGCQWIIYKFFTGRWYRVCP